MIGIGQQGLNHLRVLWKMQDEGLIHIVALCDIAEENLSESKIRRHVDGFEGRSTRTYRDAGRMFREEGMDVLYVAIPPGCHNGEIIRAAQAGIHVFAEKPMSLYLDEAMEMDQAIRRAGVLSTVGFQSRYDPRHEAVQAFLADKRMVMITVVSNGSLEGHSVKHTPTERMGGPSNRVWAASYEWSGSTVVEAGIHQVDLMRSWCGDIEWVQGTYVHRDPEDIQDGGNNPYGYTVTFGFRGGGVGNLIITRLRKVYSGDGYRSILWNHGQLRFEDDGLVAYYYDGPYPPSERPEIEAIRHPIPTRTGTSPLEAINRTFVETVITGDSGKVKSTFHSSMNSLAGVLAANASDQLKGERIYLDSFMGDPRYERFRQRPSGGIS